MSASRRLAAVLAADTWVAPETVERHQGLLWVDLRPR